MKLEGLRRIDVPEIDKAAFREAIINAFCHRDYREFDSVNIAVFKDRIEIRSPGLLYGGLTIETIRTKMVSERRNELIAEMLHRVHFIEKWGRGIKLILSKEPDAEFSEVGTKFITTFKRRSYFEGKKGFEKLGENLTQKTTQKIIEAITKKSDVTQKELATVIGITEDGVKYHITRLRKKGLLKRIGPDKGGYWEVVKK
ncbi:MAG: winged helix-turn-helix transcriptional regulator [Deltaproteobacteria bacterium]|nr:winged helix-turn-helix transcriptional regulator [Deltaproteobacteria bacterium]